MQAETVLEELATDDLDRGYVERRLEDWSDRINGLYAQIRQWIPVGWTARSQDARFAIQEAPMKRAGIEAREFPTLELIKDGIIRVHVRPHALWIIGANGRIDLVAKRGLFLIVDQANIFTPPVWQVSPMTAREDIKPFDSVQLLNLLEI